MSTSGGYHEYIGGYHEYIGGYSVHQRDTMKYIRRCSVHRRDTISTLGDIMSTSGDVQYIGGIS